MDDDQNTQGDQPAKPGDTPAAPPSAPAQPAPKNDQGYPADTPLSEMTPEQQAAYWKAQARKHEKTVKDRADYDDLKAQAAEARKLRKERESEAERLIREAAEKARDEARQEFAPRLVMAEFRAAAAGRIDTERLASLTEDIDLTRFLTADGSVDLDRVAVKVDAWAPKAPERRPAPKPDPTQGARNAKTSGTDVGREMFAARRKRPARSA